MFEVRHSLRDSSSVQLSWASARWRRRPSPNHSRSCWAISPSTHPRTDVLCGCGSIRLSTAAGSKTWLCLCFPRSRSCAYQWRIGPCVCPAGDTHARLISAVGSTCTVVHNPHRLMTRSLPLPLGSTVHRACECDAYKGDRQLQQHDMRFCQIARPAAVCSLSRACCAEMRRADRVLCDGLSARQGAAVPPSLKPLRTYALTLNRRLSCAELRAQWPTYHSIV